MLHSTRANLAGAQSCYLCGIAAPLAPRAKLALAHAQRRAAVVAMAKPTKAADLRGMSEEEINDEVYKCKRALFDLRVAQKTRQADLSVLRQAYKASEFGWNTRKIAQLLTIKRERELAEGVSKRESRRRDKKEKLAMGFGNFY